MKKIYLSVWVCICCVISNAQVQFVAAGTFPDGSPGVNIGTFKSDGTAALLHDFKFTDPTNANSVILGPGGKLYGSTNAGGADNSGVIYSIDQDGTNFKVIYNYSRTTTSKSSPVFSPDGKLYAQVSDSLFNIASDGSSVTLMSVLPANATNFVIDNEGWFYGLAYRQQGQIGVRFLFRVKANGSQYTVLHEFDEATEGSLDVNSTSICITPTQRIYLPLLYGLSYRGTLVSMKKDGSDFKIDKSFGAADENTYGSTPLTNGAITHLDGKIIFRMFSGGSGSRGTILSYDTLTSAFSIIYSFPFVVGQTSSFETHPQVINGKLIAIGSSGLYSLNKDGTNYQLLNSASGGVLNYDPSTGKIFYITAGGKYKNYYLLKTDLNTNVVNDIHSFGNVPGGYNPEGIIKAKNGLLYGVTLNGGAAGGGTIYKMNTDGTGFKTIKDFNGDDGQVPIGQLLYGSDNRLYGICKKSGVNGSSDNMVLFGVNTDGSNYSTIYNQFYGNIIPELTEGANGELFGIIGTSDFSAPPPSIFKVNKDGSGYMILKTLSNSNYENYTVRHGLVYYQGYLYGVTGADLFGLFNGSIFRISENGTSFSIMKSFAAHGPDGSSPEGGLTLGLDKKLYGLTTSGGANGRGTAFSINPQDLSFKVEGNIGANDGYIVTSKFAAASDGKLYAYTLNGILQVATDTTNIRFIPTALFSVYTRNQDLITYFSEIPTPVTTQLCPPSATTILKSDITGTTYQWQLNSGNGFENISSNANYSGTNSDSLQLINIPSSWTGYEYRCLADDDTSNIYKVKFANNWTGSASTAWENSANWSCGTIPDANTDVVINSGTIVLSSNATVRSLKVNSSVNFTVNTGFVLTVTH